MSHGRDHLYIPVPGLLQGMADTASAEAAISTPAPSFTKAAQQDATTAPSSAAPTSQAIASAVSDTAAADTVPITAQPDGMASTATPAVGSATEAGSTAATQDGEGPAAKRAKPTEAAADAVPVTSHALAPSPAPAAAGPPHAQGGFPLPTRYWHCPSSYVLARNATRLSSCMHRQPSPLPHMLRVGRPCPNTPVIAHHLKHVQGLSAAPSLADSCSVADQLASKLLAPSCFMFLCTNHPCISHVVCCQQFGIAALCIHSKNWSGVVPRLRLITVLMTS